MTYFRVHTKNIAYITQQPRGIFTAVGKLVDAKTMTEEEIAEYWKNREYFERVLPVMRVETRSGLQPGSRTRHRVRTYGIKWIFTVPCVPNTA